MNFKSIRIIPLLVFVSMLAFTVRLTEVAYGLTSLAGAAQAAAAPETAKEEHKEEEKPAEKAAEDHAVDAAKAETPPAAEAKPLAEGDKPPATEDSQDWVDAEDSDTQFSTVRHELYDNLAKRREDLDKREAEMVTREALLRAAEQEIDRKYNELSQLRGEIEKLLKQQSDEENARISSLVKIYEGMKPADAARIFDTLDTDVLMAVMSRMSERKLSPIMADMNPERAKTMTIMLAEQKQLPELPPSN